MLTDLKKRLWRYISLVRPNLEYCTQVWRPYLIKRYQVVRCSAEGHQGVSLKDDGPTGQTTGQRGSDPSAYRVSITGYYNILQGIKHETTQKTWLSLSSNAHITKYSSRTATITVKLKIKHKKYHEYAKALYIFSTYLLPQLRTIRMLG